MQTVKYLLKNNSDNVGLFRLDGKEAGIVFSTQDRLRAFQSRSDRSHECMAPPVGLDAIATILRREDVRWVLVDPDSVEDSVFLRASVETLIEAIDNRPAGADEIQVECEEWRPDQRN
ncbi:MAG: hypothetical protein GXY83_08325 [Rhodopirellula sp.]|nr:hypothetical protein [Rhodopirellula sp.]